jgi:predicted AAA+ superfamily ATPase
MYIQRLLEKTLDHVIQRGKSILLLGPRQTGKTTLINQFQADKHFTLANLSDRLRYEKNPSALAAEIEQIAAHTKKRSPLIVIDEIQKVPILMDAVQDLIDRKVAKFILTGSSARKLRRNNEMNLLPGRVIPLRLDPLTHLELANQKYSLNQIL